MDGGAPRSRHPQLIMEHEESHTKLPKILVGDQIRLKQILINLVKSALKFTSHGTIQISSYYDVAKELI